MDRVSSMTEKTNYVLKLPDEQKLMNIAVDFLF